MIARIAPDTQVIDISHGIGRHDVRQASAILADSLPYAPVGVHLAIVDPGVGGPRRAVAVRDPGGRPSPRRPRQRPAAARDRLPRREPPKPSTSATRRSASSIRSATFHGRDLFAPVAANLALGKDLSAAGVAIEPSSLERQPVSRPPARAATRLRPRRADRRLREHLPRPLPRRPGRPPARRSAPRLGRLPQAPPDRRPARPRSRRSSTAASCSTRTPPAGWRSRSTAATPARSSISGSATSSSWNRPRRSRSFAP